MAQRGMLPKIRKTAAGAQPVARPTIRPVRVTKAPPPPAPPRKFPSGVAPRGSYESREQEHHHHAQPIEQPEPTTKNGYDDPPTMSAHGAPIPKSSPPVSSIRFDDETQMRSPDGQLIAASRHPAGAAPQDDETWAREANDHHLQPLPPPQQPDLYDALPSLEMRRPYDTYEAEFQERDPATQLAQRHDDYDQDHHGHHAEHFPAPLPELETRDGSGARERPRRGYEESGESRRAPQPAYDDSYAEQPPRTVQHYEAPRHDEHHEPAAAIRETRISNDSQPAPRYEEPVIPPAPRVPAGFIVGVQPIRTPPTGGHSFRPDAYQPVQPHVQPAYAPTAYAQHQAPVQHHQAPAHIHAPQSPHSPRMHAPMNHHHAMPYAQPAYMPARAPQTMSTHPPARAPIGHQLQDPPPSASSKTLRFAWFVFGVAFGIGFTFFASGVVPGLRNEPPAPAAQQQPAPSATFPPPAPILSSAPPVQAAPVQAPPVLAPPVVSDSQIPPAASAPATQPTTPQSLPQAQPQTQPAKPQQAQTAPPQPQSSPRVASQRTIRRQAPPSNGGGAPKALPNSGSVEAPDSEGGGSASASLGGGGGGSSSPKPAEVPKDLFGAALNP